MSIFQTSKIMLMATAIVGFAASPSLALTFNAAADFSTTNNPNGVWRYGWSQTLGSVFNQFSQTDTICNGKLNRWIGSFSSNPYWDNPAVGHNNTGSTLNCGTGQHSADELSLAPGANGQYSILRWVAPGAGTYTLSTKFAGADFVGPTTTDVHVLRNGSSIFNDLVNGFGAASAKSFATTLSINAGDILDFAVGYGSNQTFWFDTTSVAATISTSTPTPPASVPEPTSALSLLAFGIFGAGFFLKRKQPASDNSLN